MSVDKGCELSETEKASLFYISGYVAFKEGILPESEDNVEMLKESEFTTMLSRGKLRLPPKKLYHLCSCLFSYFKSVSDTSCTTRLLIAFEQIFETTFCEFQNKRSILRRFANTFQKGYVKSKSDEIIREKKQKQKENDVKAKRLRFC